MFDLQSYLTGTAMALAFAVLYAGAFTWLVCAIFAGLQVRDK